MSRRETLLYNRYFLKSVLQSPIYTDGLLYGRLVSVPYTVSSALVRLSMWSWSPAVLGADSSCVTYWSRSQGLFIWLAFRL